MRCGILLTLCFALVAWLPGPSRAQSPTQAAGPGRVSSRAVEVVKEIRKDSRGREYYLYRPKKLLPGRPYWLVAGIHAFGGTGKQAGGFEPLTSLGNCIVVGPTFSKAYVSLDDKTDTQLLTLFARLKKEFLLHDKLFIAGFSAGAQYAHRFALRHPGSVVGCVAISGGSWATGDAWKGDEAVTLAARGVLFSIACGTADTGATLTSSRLRWAQKFAGQLIANGNMVKEIYWKNHGHAFGLRAQTLAKEALLMATTGRGLSDGIQLEKQIDASCAAAASASYPKALATISALGRIAAKAPPKEQQPLNAPAGRKKPHSLGWHVPTAKASWFAKHAQQRMAVWKARLIRVVAARARQEARAMKNNQAAASRARIAAIRATFAKHPSALALIFAAVK